MYNILKGCDFALKLLEDRILKDGKALNNDILKVDSFLNHQVDPKLMKEIGIEFAKYFKSKNVTKIFTIESSGIAPAVMTALELNVPLVILKKQTSKILSEDIYSTEVKSFTKNNIYNLTLSQKYITKDDNILIIDDFLANGEAASGALRLVKMANASIVGLGIVIEKAFQPGRNILNNLGYDVYSLARIKSLGHNNIEFISD